MYKLCVYVCACVSKYGYAYVLYMGVNTCVCMGVYVCSWCVYVNGCMCEFMRLVVYCSDSDLFVRSELDNERFRFVLNVDLIHR